MNGIPGYRANGRSSARRKIDTAHDHRAAVRVSGHVPNHISAHRHGRRGNLDAVHRIVPDLIVRDTGYRVVADRFQRRGPGIYQNTSEPVSRVSAADGDRADVIIGDGVRLVTEIVNTDRSEERRVGKECRSRWS